MHSITAIYLVTFFYAFHNAIPVYSESTFLESLVPVSFIGFIYSIAAVISILVTLNIGKLLVRFSNRSILIASGISEGIFLLGIAFSPYTWLSVILFILKSVTLSVLFVSLNILVETVSQNKDTGKIRGVYLTILNIGIITGPFFAALILNKGLHYLFFISALCLLPMIYVLIKHLGHTREQKYITPHLYVGFNFLKKHRDVQIIVFAQYILELFYTIMIVYGPLYLIENNILNLQTYLGVVVPIILIPFILIPYPLGRLADNKLGEKELLVLGILLMIVGTSILALLNISVLIFYIFTLFIARLGASMVEEMASSYFYKQVDHSQADLISIFVNTRNLALISGPLIGSIVIYNFSLQTVFFVLVGVLVLSLLPILKLHDTK